MKTEIKQDRAAKTYEKLITTGFEIMSQKGYHQVTMDEVAKAAGVATGSAYRYFKNKKELFIGILDYYYSHIESFAGIADLTIDKSDAFRDYLPAILEHFYEIHQQYWAFHEELEGLCHTDPDIANMKRETLRKAVAQLISEMPEQVQAEGHIREKLYMAIQALEDISHMMMNVPEEDLDIDYMKDQTIGLAQQILGI